MHGRDNLVIHVGYPKTATTTFQRHLFPHHPDIDYLGKTIPDFQFRTEELQREIHRLINEDEVRYDNASRLREIVRSLRETSKGKVLLISHENFVHPWGNDKGLIARRIQNAFGPCRILITLRNQFDLLRSFYTMHGKFCECMFVVTNQKERIRAPLSFDDWFKYSLRAVEHNLPSVLQYHDVVRYYIALFGRENVGVLLFEEFVQDPGTYVRKLSDFLGIDAEQSASLVGKKHENQRFTKIESLYLGLTRYLPLPRYDWTRTGAPGFVKKFRNWLGNSEVQIGEESEVRIFEMYSEGNRTIADELDLPLAEFGYPCPPRSEAGRRHRGDELDQSLPPRQPLCGSFVRDSEYCWRVELPEMVVAGDDCSNLYRSRLHLFEEGVRLRPAHSSHADIRTFGAGRYSHWERFLYFSTSDNSDPNTNGRTYSYQVPEASFIPRLARLLQRIPTAAGRRLRAG